MPNDSALQPGLQHDRTTVLAIFLCFTLLGFLCTNFPTWGWPGGDGRDYGNITEALVEGQSFDLRHSTRPMRGSDDGTVVVSESGAIYSIFPMGKALVQAPLLGLARLIGDATNSPVEKNLLDNLSFSATTAILYGLSACLLFLLLHRCLAFTYLMSLLGVLLYSLFTLAFPFSKIHGVESFQIVLFMGMVYSGLRPGRWSLAIVTLCFSWAVVTKPPSAVALPVVGYLFFKNDLWGKAHWPSRVMALLAASGFAALFFYYNWLRSGDPSASYAVGHAAESTFALARIPGTLWPLLVGPERNLFLNNPILFLVIPGLLLFRNRTYVITAGGLWLGMLLLYGASGNTNWGAYVGNGRYAVPFIFLLIPFVLASVQRIYRLDNKPIKSAAYLLLAGLFMVSFYVQVLYASYSEFHVKQYEYRYNHQARALGRETLVEATHQLEFAHKLFWYTQSCHYPSQLASFPYPSQQGGTAEFAAGILRSFNTSFFCKDYFFLNDLAFPSVSWFKPLRVSVLVLLLLSMFLLMIAVRLPYREKRLEAAARFAS